MEDKQLNNFFKKYSKYVIRRGKSRAELRFSAASMSENEFNMMVNTATKLNIVCC